MRELALFAGAGGGILGGHLLGWQTVCAVEWAKYPRDVLLARQRDGMLPRFPIWDDVQTFDGNPWRGRVDIVTGGFPCQDISAAGKGAGIDGERSGMWRHMARIIGEVRPSCALMENSPRLTRLGLGRVLGDLAALGYDAEWDMFRASDVGAEHERERIWILAYANVPQRQGGKLSSGTQATDATPCHTRWGKDKPGVDRMAYGVANQLDRLKAIGNGQVPRVVPLAWETLRRRAGLI